VLTHEVVDGDTWESIAQAYETPASWLMMNNGVDPNGDPPPDDPEAGTVLNIPPDPPDHCIAPENSNSLELGPGGLASVRIRLHDDTPSPMTDVRYAATCQGGSSQGVSDDGWVTLYFPAGACATVDLQWGAPDEDSDHPYRTVLVTDCFAGTVEDQAIAQLINLGYDAANDLPGAVRSFQVDYGVDEDGLNDDGSLREGTQAALDDIFGGDCDATQPQTS
jgi:LysM repeat protein